MPSNRAVIIALRIAVAIIFAPMMSSVWCYSADIVFIRSARELSTQQQELEEAAKFYGLTLRVFTITDNNGHLLSKALQRGETVAVAIAGNALDLINERRLLQVVSQRLEASVPVLILDVTQDTNPTLLKSWSSGAVIACKNLQKSVNPFYSVGRISGLTGPLGGLELPLPNLNGNTSYLSMSENGIGQIVTAIRKERQVFPIFIATFLGKRRVFLCSKTPSLEGFGDEINGDGVVSSFAAIAPMMIFVKYAAGERGWHAIKHYANLTIDDPWLRESYGNLKYKDLLWEMEKHNFHTTIAFIPWNYDRSDLSVVSLFRNNPKRFSICIHGNNHNHTEFGDLGNKPLPFQVTAIRESLNRMERFQAMTGIPYDKVMVFPHNIAAQSLLGVLKNCNFLATINENNVPVDGIKPSELSLKMRTVSRSWSDFPSIRRYTGNMPNSRYMAINSFLDNPLLFYSHHDLFAGGIGAFNVIADQVNKLDPDICWSNLGDIVKHLYLIRLRDDSNYDVFPLSNNISIENTSDHDSIYYIQTRMPRSPNLVSVNVDDRPYDFQRQDDYISLSITVPAGANRSVDVLFSSNLLPTSTSNAINRLQVWFLRMSSDFRDIEMSRFALGRSVVDFYYKRKMSPFILAIAACAFLLCCGCICWLIVVVLRRRARSIDRIIVKNLE